MSLLSDTEIVNLCKFPDSAMIRPFSPVSRTDNKPGHSGPSWGLSSTGYDIRLADKWKHSQQSTRSLVQQTCYKDGSVADPKLSEIFTDLTADSYVLVPGQFVLAVSMEEFKIPSDVMGICTGKSTLARMGIIVLVTPLEAGWEGYLTLELFNAGPNPVSLSAGIGICQINFFKTAVVPHKSYMHRSGKYQGQQAMPVSARVV